MDIIIHRFQDKMYFMISLWLYTALHIIFDQISHISIARKDKINFFSVLGSPIMYLSNPHKVLNLFFWSFPCICLTMGP